MKLHHYLFSFKETKNIGEFTTAVTLAVPHQRVTAATMARARLGAGVTSAGVLLAVSYLGHMTMADFQSQADIPGI
ncbi:hypothetical protein SO486_05280 [Pseudomonas salmasensis]|uniref:Uncharacterized protein n=1 Tax=Pseudomonas salmasensis TaxID=2745514 RepID=A0ABU5FB59_9PSED|nr:hypothetical protein [Pseudomonas salmasensis]MDY4299408.1 hypothetical protein [Pseudomonas salmasensis]